MTLRNHKRTLVPLFACCLPVVCLLTCLPYATHHRGADSSDFNEPLAALPTPRASVVCSVCLLPPPDEDDDVYQCGCESAFCTDCLTRLIEVRAALLGCWRGGKRGVGGLLWCVSTGGVSEGEEGLFALFCLFVGGSRCPPLPCICKTVATALTAWPFFSPSLPPSASLGWDAGGQAAVLLQQLRDRDSVGADVGGDHLPAAHAPLHLARRHRDPQGQRVQLQRVRGCVCVGRGVGAGGGWGVGVRFG